MLEAETLLKTKFTASNSAEWPLINPVRNWTGKEYFREAFIVFVLYKHYIKKASNLLFKNSLEECQGIKNDVIKPWLPQFAKEV